MAAQYYNIKIKLGAKSFKRFATFDMNQNKRWKGVAVWAGSLFLLATLLFAIQEDFTPGNVLGSICIAIAVLIPTNFFRSFYSSVDKQIERMKLDPPRHVYTLELTNAKQGVTFYHAGEKQPDGRYFWDKIHAAWRTRYAIYLYVTPEKSVIIPSGTENIDLDEVWEFMTKHLNEKQIHVKMN